MNHCPHPADACCEPPCPTTPNGFAANAFFASSLLATRDNADVDRIRGEGRATATSLISQEDAEEKALAEATRVALARLDYLIERYYAG